MKKLLLILTFLPAIAFSQGLNLSGIVDYQYKFGKDYLPIKVQLTGTHFADSTVMDSSYHFHFRNLKQGVYQLRINGLAGRTGFADILVKDIDINADLLLPVITLQKVKLCESAPVILGMKKDAEYYPSGKLKAQGKYLHTFKIVNGRKYPHYKKTGMWTYYMEDGSITQKDTYFNDDLRENQLFYPNGKIKLISHYSNGCRSGDWSAFAKDGSLLYAIHLNGNDLYLTTIPFKYLKAYSENSDLLQL